MQYKSRGWSGALCSVVMLACVVLMAGRAGAAPIAFQGVLKPGTGGAPINGGFPMRFRLYDTAVDGVQLWQEELMMVQVTDGRFTAYLGQVAPFPDGLFRDHPDLWMEFAADLNGGGIEASDTYSPRTRLAAAATAKFAEDAASLGGQPANTYATQLDVSNQASALSMVSATTNALQNSVNTVNSDLSALTTAFNSKNYDDKYQGKLAHTVTVSDTGSPVANGTALLAEIAKLTADQPTLILLDACEYNLGTSTLSLPASSAMQGLGKSRTTISFAGSSGAAVIAAGDTDLRDLRIENNGSTSGSALQVNASGYCNLRDVSLYARISAGETIALDLLTGGVDARDCDITATGPDQSFQRTGCRASDGTLRLRDTTVNVNTGSQGYLIYQSNNATVLAQRCTFIGFTFNTMDGINGTSQALMQFNDCTFTFISITNRIYGFTGVGGVTFKLVGGEMECNLSPDTRGLSLTNCGVTKITGTQITALGASSVAISLDNSDLTAQNATIAGNTAITAAGAETINVGASMLAGSYPGTAHVGASYYGGFSTIP